MKSKELEFYRGGSKVNTQKVNDTEFDAYRETWLGPIVGAACGWQILLFFELK